MRNSKQGRDVITSASLETISGDKSGGIERRRDREQLEKGKAIQKSKGRDECSCELSGCGGKDARGVATSALVTGLRCCKQGNEQYPTSSLYLCLVQLKLILSQVEESKMMAACDKMMNLISDKSCGYTGNISLSLMRWSLRHSFIMAFTPCVYLSRRTQGITTEALWYGHCQFASKVSLQKFAWWVRFCCKKNI